jgi:antitoxin component YwqK of YwqJK toxin-antitoxin module
MKYIFSLIVFVLLFGACSNYNTNSKNSAEFKINKNSYSGEIVEFYKNGVKKYKLYYNNGIKDGEYTNWYPTGTTKVKGLYKDGKRVGIWRWYDENGKEYFAIDYKNTKLGAL